MNKRILNTAAIMAIIAIIFGAFGAHKLKTLLTVESLQAFETGVRYQMYHVFLLLFLGMYKSIPMRDKKVVHVLTLLGVCLFSGSIYLLSTSKITGVDFSSIGILTPIGGMLLIITWVFLLRSFLKINNS